MSLFGHLRKITPKHIWSWIVRHENIDRFAFDNSNSIVLDIQTKFNFDGDLLYLFANNKGPILNKWHHYIPIYDKHLKKFRNTNVKILEIGVSKGGSLKMWREYFGGQAIIYGIDIDASCIEQDGQYGFVRIGDQKDKKFLDRVISEIGDVDIVIDDGSHHMSDIRNSFEHLFPKINFGGIYIVEDLHTSFWRSSGGGFRSKRNFLRYITRYIMAMHHSYHQLAKKSSLISNIDSLHIYDSIVVFEKGQNFPPTYSKTGTVTF